ncbi:MAG TPA: hypothetical protein VKY73_16850 [Polyangiaceae bacterium]|nr:hypothetical protein [Polyangiaceae bacterium]
MEICGFGSAEVITGTKFRSILALGSDFSYELGGGAAVRLLRAQASNTELSVRARGSYSTGGAVDFLRVLDEVVAEPVPTVESVVDGEAGRLVVKDSSGWDVIGHVLVAQRIHARVGVQAGVGLGWSTFAVESYEPTLDREVSARTSSLTPEGAVAVDANLIPMIPAGAVVEYAVRAQRRQAATAPEEEPGGVTHLLSVGVHAIDDGFQAGLGFVQFFGLERVTRVSTADDELSSGTVSASYVELSLHVDW